MENAVEAVNTQRQADNIDNLPEIRLHKLKLLCETRWVEMHTTMDDYIVLYEPLLDCLGYQCNKRQLEFAVCNGSKWPAGLVVVIFLHHRMLMRLVFVLLHKVSQHDASVNEQGCCNCLRTNQTPGYHQKQPCNLYEETGLQHLYAASYDILCRDLGPYS